MIEEIAIRRIPLIVYPQSNRKLRVVSDLRNHPLKNMLALGILATVNSNDPAYFCGYVNEIFLADVNHLNLSKKHIATLAKNSLKAGFLSVEMKKYFVDELERFYLLNY